MKNITLLVIGGVVGASIVFAVYSLTPKQQNQGSLTGPIEYNCELSGGQFENDGCVCPLELNQTQDEMYDKETGLCTDSFGIPGGEQGETVKKLQEYQILKNQ